jgi:hypothetical protein
MAATVAGIDNMNGREILELSFGICVIVISITSLVVIIKDLIKDNDDYTNCEV